MSSSLEESGFHSLTASELNGSAHSDHSASAPGAAAAAEAAASSSSASPDPSASPCASLSPSDHDSAGASPSDTAVEVAASLLSSNHDDSDDPTARDSPSDAEAGGGSGNRSGSGSSGSESRAASSPSSETIALRSAFLQAQSRARRHEESMAFIYLHVDAKVKAAVREVSRKKRRVRALRILAANASQQAHSNAMGGIGGGAGGALAMGAPWSARSASDSAPYSFVSVPPSAHSPHRDAYLSALSSPVLASSPQSGGQLVGPRTLLGGAGSSRRTSHRHTVAPSPSMPSLALPSSSSSLSAPMAAGGSGGEDPRGPKDEVDGSFCLLPFDSGAADVDALGRPAMERSSSHQAMMEAHAALEELHSTSSTPEAPPSLQVSPHPDESKEGASGGADAYPSYHHPTLPALHAHPSSSPSHSSRHAHAHGHILATSPYHIAPSAGLPPLRKTSLAGSGRGSSTGSTNSPHFGPMQPPQSGSPAPTPTPTHAHLHAQVGLGSMLPPSAIPCGSTSIGSGGVGSFAHAPTSTSSAGVAGATTGTSSAAHIYADLAVAVQSLRESQKAFSTLANFCAPLILRSPSFLRLQEEDTLQHLGVLPRPQRDVALSSDEEMSRSAELQLDDIAAHQAMEGSAGSRTLGLAASDASGTGGSVAGLASHQEQDSIVSEAESEEHKSPRQSGSGGATSAPLSETDEVESEHPSLVIVPPASPPPPLSARSKEEEREAMKLFIKKLRAEVAEEEAAAAPIQHAPTDASSSSSSSSAAAVVDASSSSLDSAVTLEEALESCVLLHRHLTSERARLASLERSVDSRVSRAVGECRARVEQLRNDNALLRVQLAELETLRSDHSAAQLKLRNMEEILRALHIETNEKGELREGSQLQPDRKGPSRWTVASLLVLGSLVVASAFNWHRLWETVQGSIPRLLNGLGLSGVAGGSGISADSAARMAAAGAAGAATVGVATAATMASAATSEVASQTASQVASDAATQTVRQAAAAAAGAGLASRFAPSPTHAHAHAAPVRHALLQRFPALVDLITIISLPLLQIA